MNVKFCSCDSSSSFKVNAECLEFFVTAEITNLGNAQARISGLVARALKESSGLERSLRVISVGITGEKVKTDFIPLDSTRKRK